MELMVNNSVSLTCKRGCDLQLCRCAVEEDRAADLCIPLKKRITLPVTAKDEVLRSQYVFL